MKNTGSNILITGGSGLIGSHLTPHLLNKGYNVAYLSRSYPINGKVKFFKWNIKSDYVEPGAIGWADYIIHLAGANIGEKRWTEKRKKQIIESRVKSAELLIKNLKETKHNVKAIISSSAVGYYGDRGDKWVDENSPPADDFMGITVVGWEDSIKKAEELNIRLCILRTGVVLTKEGGALPRLALPIKLFAGAPLGTGNQYLSWIHIEDLCEIYLQAIENINMAGVYNAVASNPVSNKEFTKVLAQVLKRPILLPPIPKFFLKLLLGEMAETVLTSNRVSNKKLIDAGFKFKFSRLKDALQNIYEKD